MIVARHPNTIEIRVDRSGCSTCSGGCLKRLLGGSESKSVSLPRSHFSRSALDLSTGQKVKISIPAGVLVGLSSLVYLVPVLGMLLFTVLASLVLPESEGLMLVVSLLGFCSGLLVSTVLVRAVEGYARRSLVCDLM